jgi:hypothetical protein
MTDGSGGVVQERDTWFRPITNSKHLRKDGTLHHSAIKGALDPPPVASMTWSFEFSGRLLSIAHDVVKDANARADIQRQNRPAMAKYFAFHAVMHVTAATVRQWQRFKADVLHHPTIRDDAHSNLVVYDLPEDEKLTFSEALIEILTVTSAAQLPAFEAARIPPG